MNDFTHRPAPLGANLATLIGGTFEYDHAIDDHVIRVGAHVITSTMRGQLILDAHSPAAVELGRHSEGADRLAAAFRMAVGQVAA